MSGQCQRETIRVSLAHDMSGELANEMSGLSGAVSSSMTRCGHEATERSRGEAGDETTGRDVTSDG